MVDRSVPTPQCLVVAAISQGLHEALTAAYFVVFAFLALSAIWNRFKC